MSSSSGTKEPICSKSSSARSGHRARVAAQAPVDAKLHASFEESETGFDYFTSVNTSSNVPPSTVSNYLRKIQRSLLIQPFGCVIAFDEENFAILGYSENVPEMLDFKPQAFARIQQRETLLFGTDVRTLFISSDAAVLQHAAKTEELTYVNPILLHCRTSGKAFHGILHRVDVGLVIDLEPVSPFDVPLAVSALKSYKLAAKAISRLQTLHSTDISLICNVLVREVRELTGYDRVMIYKFHEDDHGEVIAENHRADLETYHGLHYPATDIPQACRFLFFKNKVRMIYDCSAIPVKVIHDSRSAKQLNLCGSKLRAPHVCHVRYLANMGCMASLVMSLTVNDEDDEMGSDRKREAKLWGLVVCHHMSPRFVPLSLRYACELLVQVFSFRVRKEVELAPQMREQRILRTQTLLCELLQRDGLLGIFNLSPNLMDLVRCDGSALYFNRKCWLLGVTPTEDQIKDIAEWLLQCHGCSTGLSTDSLIEAGYSGASDLGDAVCGMAAVKFTASDFLFWFRSHAAKEIKWAGAKHDPGDKDDGRKLHPRSSFKAFMEVVKGRCLGWEDFEMDAMHSLQLILRGFLQDDQVLGSRSTVKVPAVDNCIEKLEELSIATREMVCLIDTASIPIFAVDASGNITGWNKKVAQLTGLMLHEAIGMPLLRLVADDCINVVSNTLSLALEGKEENGIELKLKRSDLQERKDPAIVVANSCCSRDMKGDVIGVCFVGQDITEKKLIMGKYAQIKGDYVGIMRNPYALIPPIFMIDECGRCLEWNDAMQKVSGLRREEVIDQILLGEVFTVSSFGCRVKDHDTMTKLRILLNGVIAGGDTDEIVFGFFNKHGKYVETLISANRRTDAEGRLTGVLCFLNPGSPELLGAMNLQKISEIATANTATKLAYVQGEILCPLNGMKFIHSLMRSSDMNKEQVQLLRTRALCLEQLANVVDDTNIEDIEKSYMNVVSVGFNLGDTLKAITNQVSVLSHERQVQVLYECPPELSSMYLVGDTCRLQQVLSDFLATALLFTPAFEGLSVLFKFVLIPECTEAKINMRHLEFRITHPAPGIPEDLIQEMFHPTQRLTRGVTLHISQKLVRIMNGTVKYLREEERSSFIIDFEFPVADQSDH